MNVIERYVYAVTKNLSIETREDVGRELRSNIEEMLPENATDTDIREVLEKLGNPSKLATEYSTKKRYLIGPELYDNYISVLKLVLVICSISFIGIALLAWVVDLPKEGNQLHTLTDLITKVIASLGDGLTQGALWVTIIFVIIDKSRDEKIQTSLNKQWTVEDLPAYSAIPEDRICKISHKETVVSFVMTIVLTAVICFQPQLIALYTKVDGSMTSTPVFDLKQLQNYIPFILCLVILHLGLLIGKYINGYWNKSLAIVNSFYNFFLCILLTIMSFHKSLVNAAFRSKLTEIATLKDTVWWEKGYLVFVMVVIALCIADSISAFMKSSKK